MAQRGLLPDKFAYLILYFFSFGCTQSQDNEVDHFFEKIDLSIIPSDTVSLNDPTLTLQNGMYYRHKTPFSGFIKEVYESDTLKSVGSYYRGNLHGSTKTYFPNGKLETLRNYRDGLAYGRHMGYWQNGNKKFDYIYMNDKREGLQKQWYESGSKYYELNFTDDKEDGMQKAWRENGKIYINYEVKDGIRYGLQKSALCYTLKNEELK
jgi:antitoxin component YwqK of YwqJK toxin-antitoxin module